MATSSTARVRVSADISDDDELGYLAEGEVAVSVNEGTGTSSGTSRTSVSILDRLRAPTASELGHYNQ